MLGLEWSIKSSFLDYVLRMPQAEVRVGRGAVPGEAARFVYSWAPAPPGPIAGQAEHWAFRGDVQFIAHSGLLYVRIADPCLHLQGDRATLSVLDPEVDGAPRLDLVTLDLSPDPTSDRPRWIGSNVQLTETGTAFFNNVYPEGEPFDPLRITGLGPSPETG